MNTVDVELQILKTAVNKGWKVQPDQKKYKSLIKAMAKKAEDETILCPCKVYVKGMVDIAEVKCPCPEAQIDINTQGSCHCNMFQKEIS